MAERYRHRVDAPKVKLSRQRQRLLDEVASLVPPATGADCVRVAVDGVDGAGKTIFADQLAAALTSKRRDAIRISVDDFHHRRDIRYRRGRDSPEGFWLDSFNYARLASDVLEPLGPGGSRRYSCAAHDLDTDAEVRSPRRTAAPGAVLVLDGLFLHRDGLAGRWDLSIWLDVPFCITASRLAARDGTSPDPASPTLARYVKAQRYYIATRDPMSRASLVIDNSNVDAPRLLCRRLPPPERRREQRVERDQHDALEPRRLTVEGDEHGEQSAE
jgi:uridine kinase